MAKDLICPEQLKGTIEKAEAIAKREGLLPVITFDLLYEIVDKMPRLPSVPAGADTVVVIHCKDCKYHKGLNCPIMEHKFTHDNDYCSYAERREDNA